MKTKAEIVKFTTLFTGLCELFDKKISQALTGIYVEALSGYGIDRIENAIKQAAVGCRFFPKPVELIEFMSGGKSAVEDRSVSEGAAVLVAIKRIGAYQSVVFDDPVTTAVIAEYFGGWAKLCAELMADQEQWFLKDFEKAYRAYSRQNITHLGSLSGLIAIRNEAGDHDGPRPVPAGRGLWKVPPMVTDKVRSVTPEIDFLANGIFKSV